jgi:hypothetical protein
VKVDSVYTFILSKLIEYGVDFYSFSIFIKFLGSGTKKLSFCKIFSRKLILLNSAVCQQSLKRSSSRVHGRSSVSRFVFRTEVSINHVSCKKRNCRVFYMNFTHNMSFRKLNVEVNSG